MASRPYRRGRLVQTATGDRILDAGQACDRVSHDCQSAPFARGHRVAAALPVRQGETGRAQGIARQPFYL